ncbi:MAG: discoidin domain-containing protein, partial [Bacteroidota bacterium]|nr:discoidin domain-containing protein [Bacteroidota bacterium]
WQGFRGNDMDLIIDLGEPTIISKLQMNFFHYPNRLIFVPHLVSVQISMNGIDFNPVRFVDLQKQNENDAIFVYPLSIDFDPIQTRYVKIMAPNGFPKDLKISPKTELKPRIFIDEIIVE